ncbi:carbohydrate ABC transporter membrane protein 1 (CUT1 family) [Labedella gwakjiensis]|uniref:Carbohydrate ABC transporter membrane protein 1 (CUT1 family) n=1 Tax=Labedella gwakjiensis TaxID=390269 RepID=A0A2P8GTW1_9MICO|nr:sugar ABC transporter permease [Labedella gwakjiensis]PSL37396.1 carbohydrate ABC transporter membrane protein 1 (CUT1 family) [Labedella gwakjiensis]RUQ84715.1 sugar ABC transporter permease [Labedella gwakjiensis]
MTTTAPPSRVRPLPDADTPPGGSGGGTSRRRVIGRTPRAFYWMVVPALVLFAALHTVPALIGIFYSFTNYAGYGTWDIIGIGNYVALFQDDRVLRAYGFTFGVAIVATILVNVFSLLLALFLNAKIKFQSAFRGIFFIPYVLSILVVGYVFQYIFANSLPQIFSGIPLFRDNILANPDWAWLAIVTLTVWQGVAFSTILYIAGLQTIPQELYEASSIDGASTVRQFWAITFPLIGAFFTINMVLSMKNYLQVFDQIIPLTNGGPGTSTESITLLIFRGGFQGGEYAYQTTNAVVYLVVIILVSLVQFRILQRREVDF